MPVVAVFVFNIPSTAKVMQCLKYVLQTGEAGDRTCDPGLQDEQFIHFTMLILIWRADLLRLNMIFWSTIYAMTKLIKMHLSLQS